MPLDFISCTIVGPRDIRKLNVAIRAFFLHSETRALEPREHSPAIHIKLRQHHAHCQAESCDIVLYLTGVSKYAGLRNTGNDQWNVTYS